jgi:hypothetical protein
MAISDYLPTLFNAPGNPTGDAHARDAMIAALARAGGQGGDYSPIQSKWQGAARLAEGLKTGLANYAQGAAQKQGATDFAKVLAPALQQPAPAQQVTPVSAPPVAASGGGGGGGGGLGGLIGALGGSSPIGPATSVPLQALSPRENATMSEPGIGPVPMQPPLPVAPAPTPAPVSQYPSGAPGGLDLHGLQGLGGQAASPAPLPPQRPELLAMNGPGLAAPLPPVRPEAPVPVPRPEDQVPLPAPRPLLTMNGPTETAPPVPVARPIEASALQLTGAPAGIKHNNPFDVSLPISGWSGGGRVVGLPDQKGFSEFPDLETGYAAGVQRLTSRINQGYDTIAGLNPIYAQDQNWKNNVAAGSGLGLNEKLDPNNAAQMEQLQRGVLIAEIGANRAAQVMAAVPGRGGSLLAQNQPLPGSAPGLITPGQGSAQAVANSGGIYPQTATQGNPAIGAMPLPARQGLNNAPFMQPQQQQSLPAQQQNIPPPAQPPQGAPVETGPRSGLASPNLLAQNIYGQNYSDLPLFGPKAGAASPVPAPGGEGEKAEEQQLPPLQPRPRIDTKAALAYLSNPLYAGQQYAAQRQLVMQMLQHQMTQDAAGTTQVVKGPGGYNVQQNTATGKLEAYPSNPDKATETPAVKNYEYAQTHPGFQEYLQQNEDLKNHVVGRNLVNSKGQVLFAAPEGATLDPEAIDFLAHQSVLGDNSGLVGMGRGTQGATNLVAIRNRAAAIATERGIDPQGVLDNIAAFGGQKAGARTAGAIGAKTEVYGASAHNALEMAMQRSDELPRGTFMPYNQLVQAAQKMNSNEPLAVLNAATETAVNEYARATTATGASTDTQKSHAYTMLNAAQSPQAYKDIVKALQWEVDNFKNSAAGVAEGLRKGQGAAPHQGPLPIPPGPGSPAGQAAPQAPAGGQRLSPADAQKLPPGTSFIGEDGIERVRH